MMNGNPTALKYAVHVAEAGLPIDDRAVYGKIGIFAEVVHDSEIIGVRDKEDVDEYRIIDDSISDEELKEILKRTWQK